ncbi:hypothetical protein [Algibacter mikhailovii]|uniref:DUF975 family protein n=1 Tax=Algibacter mikhailovii TaxID=425498 RepID=A0A918QV27_9FLAO|nr:hypothetical protein [Algibacter mikhailovii]GGZ72726.1 hypothetical protein GCM10007028_07190 [Algibacter mikhailovii]
MTYEFLLNKIQRSKELDFGVVFDQVIALFKKVYLKGCIMLLITMAMAFLVNIVFTAIGLAPKNDLMTAGIDLDSFFEFWVSNVIYSIPQTILITTLSTGLIAGFYKICKQTDLGEPVVDDYFYFFKKDYFSKMLTLGMISTGISVLAQLLFFIPVLYVFVPLSYFAILLFFIPVLYVFVPLSYFAIIFSNNPELSEIEIVKLSFALGHKKWFLSFGLLFVFGLLGTLGIVLCVFGILLTISVVYLPIYFIYKDVFGFDANTEFGETGVNKKQDY